MLTICEEFSQLRSKFKDSIKLLDSELLAEFINLPSCEQVYWILNGGRSKMVKSDKKSRLPVSDLQTKILVLCAQFICRIDSDVNSSVGPPAKQGETSSKLVPGEMCPLTDT